MAAFGYGNFIAGDFYGLGTPEVWTGGVAEVPVNLYSGIPGKRANRIVASLDVDISPAQLPRILPDKWKRQIHVEEEGVLSNIFPELQQTLMGQTRRIIEKGLSPVDLARGYGVAISGSVSKNYAELRVLPEKVDPQIDAEVLCIRPLHYNPGKDDAAPYRLLPPDELPEGNWDPDQPYDSYLNMLTVSPLLRLAGESNFSMPILVARGSVSGGKEKEWMSQVEPWGVDLLQAQQTQTVIEQWEAEHKIKSIQPRALNFLDLAVWNTGRVIRSMHSKGFVNLRARSGDYKLLPEQKAEGRIPMYVSNWDLAIFHKDAYNNSKPVDLFKVKSDSQDPHDWNLLRGLQIKRALGDVCLGVVVSSIMENYANTKIASMHLAESLASFWLGYSNYNVGSRSQMTSRILNILKHVPGKFDVTNYLDAVVENLIPEVK